ncbi:MAG: NahK/ErcS family hybrid sensor histidine kinase/response regulator, partial [Flavobacteriaceae bacterium]
SVLLLGFAYYRLAGNSAGLAAIGLLSFAAIAQLAPAFFFGLIWRRASAKGALAGMVSGFAVWAYTLLLPNFAVSGLIDASFVTDGPWGIGFLRPQTLFNIEFSPLTHGVFWSTLVNITALITVSLLTARPPIERLQANQFVPSELTPIPQVRRFWRPRVTVGEVQETVGKYIGAERAARAFSIFAAERSHALEPAKEADMALLRHAEFLLASAVGAASARLILSLMLERHEVGGGKAMRLLDDATAALQYNRDIMQAALDNVRHGIAVFDENLSMVLWNRQFREILNLPPELGQIGVSMFDIAGHMARRGDFGPGDPAALADERMRRAINRRDRLQERMTDGRVLEVRTDALPDGGFVLAFTDITDRVDAAEALERANETLEKRVRERTAELTRLNEALAQAKSAADEANFGKTRFLAAASHDLLQPLNAARLYAASLSEADLAPDSRKLASNVDLSLNAVEDILGAILDISRLDAGHMKPELSTFRIADIFDQLRIEFEPLARERGLEFTVVPSSISVRSDPRLLRRLLQNLVSNALKYTRRGRVVLGARRRGRTVSIEVHDTGPGIPVSKRKIIFKEFQRLDEGAAQVQGLGLGLSIVERIGQVLQHRVGIDSTIGRGSVFSVEVPRVAAAVPEQKAAADTRRRRDNLEGVVVVCVDNETRILEGMESLLSAWGCRIVTATGLRAAVKALRERVLPPDIILMDYHLDGGGNGIDAVQELRWKFGKELPAILVTADRSPEIRDAARKSGIAVLHKPVKPAALRALMSQNVSLSRGALAG